MGTSGAAAPWSTSTRRPPLRAARSRPAISGIPWRPCSRPATTWWASPPTPWTSSPSSRPRKAWISPCCPIRTTPSPRRYAAWGEKKNYGKTYQGLIRSTVVVDPDGKVAVAQYNVRATGHVAKLRRDLKIDPGERILRNPDWGQRRRPPGPRSRCRDRQRRRPARNGCRRAGGRCRDPRATPSPRRVREMYNGAWHPPSTVFGPTRCGRARVVKLADTQDLGSCAFGRGGSSPPLRTYVRAPVFGPGLYWLTALPRSQTSVNKYAAGPADSWQPGPRANAAPGRKAAQNRAGSAVQDRTKRISIPHPSVSPEPANTH